MSAGIFNIERMVIINVLLGPLFWLDCPGHHLLTDEDPSIAISAKVGSMNEKPEAVNPLFLI